MGRDRIVRIGIITVALLLAANLAVSFARQGSGPELVATTAKVQYKLIPVSNTDTAAATLALLTLEGNAGYRLVLVYPTFASNYMIFSKP
jgi:hypothetical protein